MTIDLDNRTDLDAFLFSGEAGERGLGVVLVAKATYDISGGGLERVLDASWPVHLEPLETPYGPFPQDMAHRKPRLDLILLGKAHAPGGEPVQEMEVFLELDDFKYRLAVIGDRVWTPDGDGWVPSAPEPFTELPLTYDLAFGGKAITEWGELVWPDNPEGKGFCPEPGEAEGVALPNLEAPGERIADPADRPRVVGTAPYPMTGGLRLSQFSRAGEDGPEAATPLEVEPLVCNWAHPDLMLDRDRGYRLLRVSGVSPDGDLTARIPSFPGRITLRHGPDRLQMETLLDTIIIQAEEQRLTLRWRAAVRIPMRPRELREVVLEEGRSA